MDDNSTLNQPKSTYGTSSRRVATYDILIQQSRKLGKIATHAVTFTKQLLRTETSALHPDALLFGVSSNRPSEASRLSSFTEKTHEILASVKTFPLPQNILSRINLRLVIRLSICLTCESCSFRLLNSFSDGDFIYCMSFFFVSC